jgi:hypothetical protein
MHPLGLGRHPDAVDACTEASHVRAVPIFVAVIRLQTCEK